MQKIIDAHMHIFDLEIFRVSWLDDEPRIQGSVLEKDYFEALGSSEDYRVEGLIHVELDTTMDQKLMENQYFIDKVHDDNSMVKSAVIYGDLLDPDLESFLEPYLNEPAVASVRYLLHMDGTPSGVCLKETFIDNCQMLGRKGLMFEGCLRPEDLSDFAKLASLCPDTTFVLNHVGLVDVRAFGDPNRLDYVNQWKKDIEKLGSLGNVVCKISGLYSVDVSEISEAINHCLDSFKQKNVVFTSNYPVCNLGISLRGWIKAIMDVTADRSADFTDDLFYNNAIRLYRLED